MDNGRGGGGGVYRWLPHASGLSDRCEYIIR